MPSACSALTILKWRGIVSHLCLLLSSACPAMGDMPTSSCNEASCAKQAISDRSLLQVSSGFIFKEDNYPASSLTVNTDQVVSRTSSESSVMQAQSDDSLSPNETTESIPLLSSVLLNKTGESVLHTASAERDETAESVLPMSSVLHNAVAESATVTSHVLLNESLKPADIQRGYKRAAPASVASLLDAQHAKFVLPWTQSLLSLMKSPRQSKSKHKGEEVEENASKGRSESILLMALVGMACGRIFGWI